MALFQVAKNALANASAKVSSGLSTVEKNQNESALNSAGFSLSGIWANYKKWIIFAAVGFVVWRWVLPMLGLRKKRRGNVRSLAKARRAKARKAGRL